MKKVMCINDENKWWSNRTLLQSSGPAYRAICIVLDEVQENGESGYILEGYGEEPYSTNLFIPLSKSGFAILKKQKELEMV